MHHILLSLFLGLYHDDWCVNMNDAIIKEAVSRLPSDLAQSRLQRLFTCDDATTHSRVLPKEQWTTIEEVIYIFSRKFQLTA